MHGGSIWGVHPLSLGPKASGFSSVTCAQLVSAVMGSPCLETSSAGLYGAAGGRTVGVSVIRHGQLHLYKRFGLLHGLQRLLHQVSGTPLFGALPAP